MKSEATSATDIADRFSQLTPWVMAIRDRKAASAAGESCHADAASATVVPGGALPAAAPTTRAHPATSPTRVGAPPPGAPPEADPGRPAAASANPASTAP